MNTLPERSQRGDILVVDDMPANLRLLTQMLTEHGYKVRAAVNGTWALTTARVAQPDLIVLDILMPDMDGYEVCRRLKADPQLCGIPVLFISALSEVEDKVKGFAVGGLDYITKPFQREEVLARIQTHLTLRQLQRELVAANAELAQRLAELQVKNEELDAFAHTVAHDLKGTVTNIVGFAELLQETGNPLPGREWHVAVQCISESALKMSNVIDELMLLAGVRKAQVRTRPLAMDDVVAGARQRLAYLIEEYHAEIILPDSWPVVLGYGPWIEEVWINYLSNAIRYGGQPPRVELGATLQDDQACFWVHDNGSGISPEQQARLFAPFARLGQVETKGHGLGLSIARRIVERLGGQVGVESQGVSGQGCVFTFTLPRA